MEFTHVLCALDLSDTSLGVVRYAAAIRSWFDARLTIVHVIPTLEPGSPSVPIRRDLVIEQMRRAVDESKAVVGDVTYAVEPGDPSTTVVDQGIGRAADLIVIGTHGRRGFDRLLLGSVAERVLRKAACPVLTVPARAVEPRSLEPLFHVILCPVDFSPSSLQAFGFALALARRATGRLIVLHAVEWLADDEPRSYTHFDVPEYRRHLSEHARTRLDALLASERTEGCEIEQVVASEHADKAIVRLAEDAPADLIVMGSQGRGGVGLALFGSTTQQVLRAAPCPVLTMRG